MFSWKFQGSTTTIQEDIGAIISQKQTNKRKLSTNEDSGKEINFTKHEPILFLTHDQNSEKVKYKLGEKKE